jgi:hypothetical protein
MEERKLYCYIKVDEDFLNYFMKNIPSSISELKGLKKGQFEEQTTDHNEKNKILFHFDGNKEELLYEIVKYLKESRLLFKFGEKFVYKYFISKGKLNDVLPTVLNKLQVTDSNKEEDADKRMPENDKVKGLISEVVENIMKNSSMKESLTEMIGDKGNDPDLKSKVSEVLDKMANNKEMQDSIKEMVNNMINPPNKES